MPAEGQSVCLAEAFVVVYVAVARVAATVEADLGAMFVVWELETGWTRVVVDFVAVAAVAVVAVVATVAVVSVAVVSVASWRRSVAVAEQVAGPALYLVAAVSATVVAERPTAVVQV